jgi:hypothetical protein
MLEYTGNGAYIVGVPARDLSAEEVEIYGGEKQLLQSGLYQKQSEKPKPSQNKMGPGPSENKGGVNDARN